MINSLVITKRLLTLLRIKYTNKYLKDSILSHQNHNSLLAISDTLLKYHIENTAIKTRVERLDELPLPCVVQIKKKEIDLFYVLKSAESNKVVVFDENNKLQKLSRKVFIEKWTGTCLLVETSKKSEEPNIEQKLTKKRITNLLIAAVSLLFIIWFILTMAKETTLYGTIYSILKIIGLTVGTLLLWFDVDQFNPTLQSLCSYSKNVNCNAILKSKYSNLFNKDIFNISVLAFSYFFTSLLFLLVSNFKPSAFTLLSYLSFATIPIIFTSLYYQAFVLKQWCKLCILLQIVLVLEAIVIFFGDFYSSKIIINDLLLVISLFIFPILLWDFLKPLLKKEKELLTYKRSLKKIKNNPLVFNSFLSKSNTIKVSSEGLGIIFKNKDAKYNIIKICNPYCSPCAKAHPVLEALVKSGKINLQILFTVKADINDFIAKPVSHFLAIDSTNNKEIIQKALDDWYLADKKNYEVFANKYPLNGELKNQKKKLEAMNIWCKQQSIKHTPTIFINGYELPEEYSVYDLVDLL